MGPTRYLVAMGMVAAAACSDNGRPSPADTWPIDLPAPRDAQPGLEGGVQSDVRVDGSAAPDAGPARCPPLMALVEGAFCVDLYEATLEEQGPGGSWTAASPFFTVGSRTVRAVPAQGTVPQGYISGTQAAAACAAAGKRLCSSTEWLTACQGPAASTWPYGNVYQPGACNDDYQGHPVVDYFGTNVGVWDAEHMNDPGINQQPGTVAAGGAYPACVSHWGIFDLHGNLHEWVSDAAGTFRGGFYADAEINGDGCLYKTTAHSMDYHDYSTGFRCCADRGPGS